MPDTETAFDQIQQELTAGGSQAALTQLADQLRSQGKYHELFEALKMRVREELGLPLLYNESGDELDAAQRNGLEEGLVAACKEVGMLLLEAGQLREAWIYLRHFGDRAEVARQLSAVDVDDENLEEMIELTLHEGVDPPRGFGLVLDHYGTCNAITTFEAAVGRQTIAEQQASAAMLIDRIHRDLRASLQADIEQQQQQTPTATTIAELVADRDWLFGEHSYHLDTTHLASTVRFARVVRDEEKLRLALDLTEYGKRLHPQFQYAGEEPFADLYPSHALYFAAILKENEAEALEYFREKAETVDPAQHGSAPVETYVQLLEEAGQFETAMDVLIEFGKRFEEARANVMPQLLELAIRSGRHEKVEAFCREQDDLLGFATCVLQAKQGTD